ncbi:helix-turn-helix domain-containing protein [uncultured Massilia sp.]|uniref:helix-turn-helix domain-containing protein n=1 Tax=uncultured Massilia sp. TaxID=169973 RepID=UPI0025D53327|nr:helix-turn-helix domain-containing protein [uncultured Massilia sp.]
MSSERADQPATPDNPNKIPGQTLAAQREAMGWSVEQVADQLKLAVRQVVALEAGDYASLPSPAVTRGFVRAYAKLMKLDPAPLVAQIEMESPAPADTSAATAARRPAPASFSESKFPSHGKRSSLPLGWIAGAVVVVAAAAAAWQFGLVPLGQHADGNTVAAPGTPAVTTGVPDGHAVETLQNPSVPLISVPGASATDAAPAAAPTTAAAGTAATAAPGPVVNVPSTTAAGAPPATAPVAPANPAATLGNAPVAPVAAAPAAAAPVPASGANALVLNVREDSWIEVRPAKGGAALISRLVKGGSTETVNVDQPVRVVVGNPTGVTATLRGANVALPPVPGKTLARVNLQ